MLSSFIHSKIVWTRVKSLPNDRQGRSRRKYSVPETAVWPKMFHVNRQGRHGQCLLHCLACLFKFRSRPHRSGCAFHSLSSFLFFYNGVGSVHRTQVPPDIQGVLAVFILSDMVHRRVLVGAACAVALADAFAPTASFIGTNVAHAFPAM